MRVYHILLDRNFMMFGWFDPENSLTRQRHSLLTYTMRSFTYFLCLRQNPTRGRVLSMVRERGLGHASATPKVHDCEPVRIRTFPCEAKTFASHLHDVELRTLFISSTKPDTRPGLIDGARERT